MLIRGVRGATTAELDQRGAILEATRELLEAMLNANPGLQPEDIGSAIFTVTDDLHAVYPAQAARELGWSMVPLMCASEIPVPDGIARCIRILLHWNTDRTQGEVRHVYLRGAVSLRPDLVDMG